MKLNRQKPFDTVHGGDEYGRAYLQDGKYFDLDGDEVVVEPPAKKEKAATAAVDPAAGGEGGTGESDPPAPPAPKAPAKGKAK